jgi:hypothetical protein
MSINSVRTTQTVNTGDTAFSHSTASSNAAAPGQEDILTLASGDNTITVPTGGAAPTAVTIVKPAGNTVLLKLKGAGGDTGVKLNLTAHDSVSLDSTQATFILNAAAQLVGVRLVWA